MLPVSDDKHLWVSWDEYHRNIEKLAQMVHESGWKFDQVLCLARGGLRPGDVFSRVFDVPLAILSTSSYREEAGTVRGILVDDLVDSGVTLEKVQHHLKEYFPAVTEVKSAVIWCKACSSIRPDFYLEYLESNPWIHQPFEEYDSLRPHQLGAWMKKGESKDKRPETPPSA